jgi:RNAse (barnase) inhibitor barstar
MKYEKILRSGSSGVYAAPRLPGLVRAAAKRAGIAWYDLDLEGVHDREAFLKRCAEAFRMPGYFGGNWDALHECLRDFTGEGEVAPGAVVHWRNGSELARRSPETVSTALEILRDVSMYWASAGRTFAIIVDRDSAPQVKLVALR